MPVKVEQLNEYLFSDTVQSQKTKSGSDEISQGQDRGYPKIIIAIIKKENAQQHRAAIKHRRLLQSHKFYNLLELTKDCNCEPGRTVDFQLPARPVLVSPA